VAALETAYYRLLGRYMVPCCVFLHLKPNHVSIIAMVFRPCAGVWFVFSPFWGGALTLLSGLLDTLDGALAGDAAGEKAGRLLGLHFGSLRRALHLRRNLGLLRQARSATLLITLTMFFVLFGSLMVSYTRARAEGLNVSCMVGLLQRGERIISIGVAGMVNSLVNLTLAPARLRSSARTAVLTLVLILLAVEPTISPHSGASFHVLNRLRTLARILCEPPAATADLAIHP